MFKKTCLLSCSKGKDGRNFHNLELCGTDGDFERHGNRLRGLKLAKCDLENWHFAWSRSSTLSCVSQLQNENLTNHQSILEQLLV